MQSLQPSVWGRARDFVLFSMSSRSVLNTIATTHEFLECRLRRRARPTTPRAHKEAFPWALSHLEPWPFVVARAAG